MKQLKTILLCIVLAVTLWGCGPKEETTVSVGEDQYPKDTQTLDLRDKDISIEYYEQLRALLPECAITWNVPFQDGVLSSDAEEVTVTSLTQGDIQLLSTYFPNMKTVHAEGCKEYDLLIQLEQAHPDWNIEYYISLSNRQFTPPLTGITSLLFVDGDADEFMANLSYFPDLTSLHFTLPTMPAEKLIALQEAYPNITITWKRAVLGVPYSNDITELDLSNAQLDGTEALEAELAYFPSLEKVLLCHCNLDSETLAAYRDRVRDQYKVVWSVKLGRVWTRTDAETYMPIREGDHVMDMHLKELKYCEDLIIVDLGHMGVIDTEWIYHTPKLQFLILADTDVSDITPIGTLKDLIYLELFKSFRITDYTPLLGCTALQDLNVAFTRGDITVLAEMTWLDSLWANQCKATPEQKQYVRDHMPDTLLELDHGWHMGNGWRDRPNYYVMRDILQMPYYDYGSKRAWEEYYRKFGRG